VQFAGPDSWEHAATPLQRSNAEQAFYCRLCRLNPAGFLFAFIKKSALVFLFYICLNKKPNKWFIIGLFNACWRGCKPFAFVYGAGHDF
jgi:hypothetical protein